MALGCSGWFLVVLGGSSYFLLVLVSCLFLVVPGIF